MSISVKELLELVDNLTHGYCEQLALSLHFKTGLPICAIYDPSERVYVWGVNYWAFFIKVNEDCYLNAQGLFTKREMIAFWANAWEDSSLEDRSEIIEKMPDYDMRMPKHTLCDFIPGLSGPIPSFVEEYANLLIKVHL